MVCTLFGVRLMFVLCDGVLSEQLYDLSRRVQLQCGVRMMPSECLSGVFKMKKFVALLLTSVIAVTGCSAGGGEIIYEPVESSEQEMAEARPQDDFYRYINEDALKNAEFKQGSSVAASPFDDELVRERIDGIFTEVINGSGYAVGSEEYMIKKAYDLYVQYDFQNSPVPEDIVEIFDEIMNASTIDEIMDIDARLYRDYGISNLINIAVSQNDLRPECEDLYISRCSSILGTGIYELDDSFTGLTSCRDRASRAMQYLGYDEETADQYGTELAYLALDIYYATNMDIVRDGNSTKYVFEMTPAEVQEIFSNIDLNKYLSTIGYDMSKCERICAVDREQLAGLNSVLVEKNLNALKAKKAADIIAEYGEYIVPGSEYLSSNIMYVHGDPEKEATIELKSLLAEQLDVLYAEKYYTDEMDKDVRKMVDDIRSGYKELISQASWLSEETKSELLKKLENILTVTAKDKTRQDKNEFSQITGENYYEFCRNFNKFLIQKNAEKLGTEHVRKESSMLMQEMNACYDPTSNTITITAAIMIDPFYNHDADYFTNLGALGSIVAHEIGHAFDSNCIYYDSNGKFDTDWLKKEDIEALEARNQTAVEYFEDFTVFRVYHVNGERTLGENYADLGGMECILSLAKTDDQRKAIFTSYAIIWRQKILGDAVIDLIGTDVHSPAVIRVNSILSTLDAFYETYDVQEGDGMYIAPENRISRWY